MEGFRLSQGIEQKMTGKFESLIGSPLTTISYDEVPEDVKKYFESQSSKFILPEEYHTQNFQKLYTFSYLNGDICYIAEQDKTYGTNGDTERHTYFMDRRGDKEIGYLELRLNISNQIIYFKGKPFVGFTRTAEDFQSEGLGERRLRVANAYSLEQYNVSLNSSAVIEEEAKRIWERLVEKGDAEKYKEGKHERFRFVIKN